MFSASAAVYAFVQPQNISSQIERAQASEIQDSQLQLIEQQIKDSQNNQSTITTPQIENQELDEAAETDILDETPVQTPQEFINRKPPEITDQAAQTKVNLIVTDD
jgi:hypothetical protein